MRVCSCTCVIVFGDMFCCRHVESSHIHTHTRMYALLVCVRVCVLFWRVGMPWQVPYYSSSKLFIASFSFSRLSVLLFYISILQSIQLFSKLSVLGGFAN